MPKYTVPDFIGNALMGLTPEDRYHLFEGFGVQLSDPVEITFSGMYAKIRMDSERDYLAMLGYLGYGQWWTRYKIKRSVFGKHWALL